MKATRNIIQDIRFLPGSRTGTVWIHYRLSDLSAVFSHYSFIYFFVAYFSTLSLLRLSFIHTLINLFIHSFTHQSLYRPLWCPLLFFSFVIFFTQTVGPLGRGISLSQGRYLHTRQHKYWINAHSDVLVLTVLNSVDLVRKQTIPTERPQPVVEVSANFSW
jgi:hypothetical protein